MATHINNARWRHVASDKLDLTMDELRHMFKCEKYLGTLAMLRKTEDETQGTKEIQLKLNRPRGNQCAATAINSQPQALATSSL